MEHEANNGNGAFRNSPSIARRGLLSKNIFVRNAPPARELLHAPYDDLLPVGVYLVIALSECRNPVWLFPSAGLFRCDRIRLALYQMEWFHRKPQPEFRPSR